MQAEVLEMLRRGKKEKNFFNFDAHLSPSTWILWNPEQMLCLYAGAVVLVRDTWNETANERVVSN